VGLVDKVEGGTVISKWTTLIDVVLPVVQLWICGKRKVVDLSSGLETQRVVGEISPL
jgi:hypothetical protein